MRGEGGIDAGLNRFSTLNTRGTNTGITLHYSAVFREKHPVSY